MNEIPPRPPMPSSPPPLMPNKPSNNIFADPKKRKVVLIGSGVLLVVMVALGVYAFTRISAPAPIIATPTPTPAPTPTPTPAELPSRLNGVMVPSELSKRHIMAIVVENHPDARPQSGLSDAPVVYEGIAEGGITRFLALFDTAYPQKVGPVRSARPLSVEVVQEFQPISAWFAHVGGSANALQTIAQVGISDLDPNYAGAAYQRFPRKGIATEHTDYTFPDRLLKSVQDRKLSQASDFRVWKFKDDADAAVRPDSQTITIPFSSASYEVKYTYDKATNSYKRQMAGKDHIDANNNRQINPKVVVIQFTDYHIENSGHKDVNVARMTGKGNAKIIQDGKSIDATWTKANSKERTIFTDKASGNEIEFDRGQIFVEIPNTGTNVTIQ